MNGSLLEASSRSCDPAAVKLRCKSCFSDCTALLAATFQRDRDSAGSTNMLFLDAESAKLDVFASAF
jgi:hypothetical protein